MATNIVHARKTVVNVTDELQLDAFTVDNLEIIWGYDWVENFKINKKYLSDKKSKYYLAKLSKSYSSVEKSLGCYKSVRVKGINATYNTMNRQVFTEVLVSLVELGHHEILPILAALATEALEERAKEQLGIDLTSLKDKEERTKIIARREGKKVRRTLTDAIQDYCKRHDKLDRQTIYYIHVSDGVNLAIFGKKSKQLKEELGVKKPELLRDYLDKNQLKLIEKYEDRIIEYIDLDNLKPIEAMKLTVNRLSKH